MEKNWLNVSVYLCAMVFHRLEDVHCATGIRAEDEILSVKLLMMNWMNDWLQAKLELEILPASKTDYPLS